MGDDRRAAGGPPPPTSPFPTAWWSFALGRHRPCDGTYQRYPTSTLPPLPGPPRSGDLAWLRPTHSPPPALDLTPTRVALPPAFQRFMADPSLQAAVPSITGCTWTPTSAPVPCRVVPGAHTLRFLRDPQDALFWYLHLLPGGDAPVLCSPLPFDDPELTASPATILATTWRCAPDFEQFVLRLWIESGIRAQLDAGALNFSPVQRDYLDHYAALRARPARLKVLAPADARKSALKSARKAAAPRLVKRATVQRLSGVPEDG